MNNKDILVNVKNALEEENFLSCPTNFKETVEKEGFQSKFVVEGLEKGMGLTIGNSLRRVMLSCGGSVKVAAFSIDGVLHEFQVSDSIREDMIQISLNLKQLALKSDTINQFKEPIFVSCKKIGPGYITANDFNWPEGIKPISDSNICYINTESQCIMNLIIIAGHGFVGRNMREIIEIYKPTEDKNESSGSMDKYIMLDTYFASTERMFFESIDTPQKGKTEVEKLICTVVTNGARTPRQCFLEAVCYLYKSIGCIKDLVTGEEDLIIQSQKVNEEENMQENNVYDSKLEATLSMSVDDIFFKHGRVSTALKNNNIYTVRDLVLAKKEELENMKGIGKNAIVNIEKILISYDIELEMNVVTDEKEDDHSKNMIL